MTLFPFLKYISPTWYFNLQSKGDYAYFVNYDLLSEANKNLINWDNGYSSTKVSRLDAAYQAWNKGVVESDSSKKIEISELNLSIKDNYRFVRRFFHPFWGYYILILRLISLHNPIREIAGFMSSRKINRIKLYENVYSHLSKFNNFNSNLLSTNPKVSVIIPTLNRYVYLKDVLLDLEKQEFKNFDVIVVDQSEPFQSAFYSSFQLDLKLIRQKEKALWLARDTAIMHSEAKYLLLFDDDSRVESDWISQHLKCIDYFNADISSGTSISVSGNKVPQNYSFFRWGDQVDTGNVLIKRDVFKRIGLFDRQFERQRMGDGEFGLRAYLAGFKNISNPLAQRLHLKVGEGGLRQMGSWDGFRPKNWLAPRPVPSVLYLIRKYFGTNAAIASILIGVPPSLLPYKYKRYPHLLLWGCFLIFPLFPLILWQIWLSWAKSSKMLLEGNKISSL